MSSGVKASAALSARREEASTPRAAIGHMPFRGSRTQQQVREDQARSPTPQQIQAEERLDRFAELLSQGLDLDVIAQRMGVRRARVGQLLVIIRKRMGRQAA